jgi:hypothetical protein
MSAETGAQIAAVDAGLARKSKVRSTRAKATVLPFKPTLACDYRDDCLRVDEVLSDLAGRGRKGELRGAVLVVMNATGEFEYYTVGTLARSVEKAHWAASLLQDLKLDKGRG